MAFLLTPERSLDISFADIKLTTLWGWTSVTSKKFLKKSFFWKKFLSKKVTATEGYNFTTSAGSVLLNLKKNTEKSPL